MAGLGLILAFSLINYAANSFAYYYRHVKNLNGLRISIKISKISNRNASKIVPEDFESCCKTTNVVTGSVYSSPSW